MHASSLHDAAAMHAAVQHGLSADLAPLCALALQTCPVTILSVPQLGPMTLTGPQTRLADGIRPARPAQKTGLCYTSCPAFVYIMLSAKRRYWCTTAWLVQGVPEHLPFLVIVSNNVIAAETNWQYISCQFKCEVMTCISVTYNPM